MHGARTTVAPRDLSFLFLPGLELACLDISFLFVVLLAILAQGEDYLSLQPLCKLHEPNHGITDSLPIALSSTVFPLTNSYLRTSPLRLDLPAKLPRTPLDLRVCYIKENRAGGSWFLVRSPPPFSIPIALLLAKVVKREGRRTAYRARSVNRQIIRLISKDITQTRWCTHLSSISPSSQGCSKGRDLRSDLKHLKGLESTDLHQIPCTLSSCDNRAVLYLRVSLASAPRARCTRAQYCADSTFILCCAKSSHNSVYLIPEFGAKFWD
ncbi:hypothetical protein K438DRAFT_1940033 [Mycena galopus ATCC 62051]|nr:hypothetical protein K438DRAFT_1940033 [Mycena galopus ATCC 62051]